MRTLGPSMFALVLLGRVVVHAQAESSEPPAAVAEQAPVSADATPTAPPESSPSTEAAPPVATDTAPPQPAPAPAAPPQVAPPQAPAAPAPAAPAQSGWTAPPVAPPAAPAAPVAPYAPPAYVAPVYPAQPYAPAASPPAPYPAAPYAPPGAAPAPGTFQPRASPLLPGASGYAPPMYAPPPAAPQPYSYGATYPAPRVEPVPSTVTLPAPPPGYVYMAVPQPQPTLQLSYDPARREELYNELNRVNLRLDQLRRERVSIGGPITFMIIGFSTALVSTAVSLGNLGAAEKIEGGDYFDEDVDELDRNDNGQIDAGDEQRFRRTARISAGVGVAGFVLGLLSAGALSSRVGERREKRTQTKALSARRSNLQKQLDFGANAYPGGVQLRMQGQF